MADITSILGNLGTDYMSSIVNGISSSQGSTSTSSNNTTDTETAFSSILNTAMGLVQETNTLANNADAEQMNFSMGLSDNTHDLQIAQQKAALSLQYTVAVKNQLLSAYKEIMNIQI